MSITRRSLSEKLAVEHGLSMREARGLVDSVFEEMAGAIETERSVKLSGFGSFSVHETPERLGRNPRTGEPALVTARKRVAFKPAPKLVKRINDRE